MANAWASHGSRKTGSPRSSGMPERLASERASGRLEVGFPGIHRYFQLGIALGAPQFAAIEANDVEPLRILAPVRGVAVRKDVTAVHALDCPDMAADIARQAGMSVRVQVLGTHAVARLEPGRRIGLARDRCAPREHTIHLVCGKDALDRLGRPSGSGSRDFVRRDETALREQVLEPGEPKLVIAFREIIGRRAV